MPMLIRLSESMNIVIPSSLKIHQTGVQLPGGADPAGSVTVERAYADSHGSASAPFRHASWAKQEFWNLVSTCLFWENRTPRCR